MSDHDQLDADESRLTHRCPACAGTGHKPKSNKECPVCEPFGPFGLVPYTVAIEQSLVGPCKAELMFRKRHGNVVSVRNDVLDWLLEDRPIK